MESDKPRSTSISANIDVPRTIVIPIDGTENSDLSFKWYVDNLLRSTDTVYVLHVSEPVSMPLIKISEGKSWEEKLQDKLNKVQEMEKFFNYELESLKIFKGGMLVVYSDTANKESLGYTIITEAEKRQANLIIMTSRGLSRMRRRIFGSVSDYVINNANVPVLILPPGSREDDIIPGRKSSYLS